MDDGSNVTIESNTTINGAEFWITEGMNITIGEDCMFAKNIELRTGDNHAIFQGNKRLNKGGSISIGNHVWIGANAKIMKLAHIRMDFRGIMQSAWTRKG